MQSQNWGGGGLQTHAVVATVTNYGGRGEGGIGSMDMHSSHDSVKWHHIVIQLLSAPIMK